MVIFKFFKGKILPNCTIQKNFLGGACPRIPYQNILKKNILINVIGFKV